MFANSAKFNCARPASMFFGFGLCGMDGPFTFGTITVGAGCCCFAAETTGFDGELRFSKDLRTLLADDLLLPNVVVRWFFGTVK